MPQKAKAPKSRPTSKDVAALAGVSQSTVSYVMSGKRAISPDVRRRVERAIETLSYEPNAGARALRSSKTNVIALAVQLNERVNLGETAPYIDTIIEEASLQNYDVVLSTRDQGAGGIERLAQRGVCDALILMDIRANDHRIPIAASLGLPVVLLGRPTQSYGLDAVDFDARSAAMLLVDELTATGHRHIVIIGELEQQQNEHFPFVEDFQDGARRRAAENGIPLTVVDRPRDGIAGIEAIGEDVLANQNKLGIITRTPQVTEWLLQALRLRNIKAGQDVSVVSLCSDTTARTLEPAVTNVSSQPRTVSRRAVEILFERLNNDNKPARLELVTPGPVTRRHTTASFN